MNKKCQLEYEQELIDKTAVKMLELLREIKPELKLQSIDVLVDRLKYIMVLDSIEM